MNVLPAIRSRNQGTAADYDPLARIFIAQDQRPAAIAPVAATALSAFQRALLVIDGTVTQFIEAWACEPVEVRRLDQREFTLETPERWLELDTGAPVIRRCVMLRGARSGQFYTWAESWIAAARVDAEIRRGLEREGGGIGRILIDAGVESRREALWYGKDRPGGIPPEVATVHAGEFLVRSYRLLVEGRPLMLITERFPL